MSSVVMIRPQHKDGKDGERLRIQIGMTPSDVQDGFFLASTHFDSRKFTSAIMIGCSDTQIQNVIRLVRDFNDVHRHPLFMLGIFAELQLRRLEDLVTILRRDHGKLSQELLKAGDSGNTANNQTYILRPKESKFSWDQIKKVLSIRDELQEAQAELETSKRQLERVSTEADEILSDPHEGEDNKEPKYNEETQKNAEVAQLFSERFHDIIHRFEDLLSECLVCVESLSFYTELVRLDSHEGQTHNKTRSFSTKTLTGIRFAVSWRGKNQMQVPRPPGSGPSLQL